MCGAANSRALFWRPRDAARSKQADSIGTDADGRELAASQSGRSFARTPRQNRKQSQASVVSTRGSEETADTECEPARAKGPQQKADIGPQEPRARASVCVCAHACLRICDGRESIPREAFQFARRNTHKRDIVDSPPTPANATDRHCPSGRAVPSIRGAPQGRGSVWNHDGKVHAFSLQSRPILRKPNGSTPHLGNQHRRRWLSRRTWRPFKVNDRGRCPQRGKLYLPSLGTTPHYSRGHDSGVASWMAFRDANHSSLGPMSRAAAVSLFTPNGRDITPEQGADVSGGLRGIRAAARRLREGKFAQYRSRTHQWADLSGRLVLRTEPFGTATAGVRRLFLNRGARIPLQRSAETLARCYY